MKQRILTLILMVSIVISMATIPISVSAATNGGCGESLKWSLDDNGTLTVSGEGEMYDYNYDVRDGKGYTNTPWRDKTTLIKRVIIGEGVTRIGDYAFRDCGNLTDVTFPNGLIEIGSGAFMSTDIAKVILPDSVKKLDNACFCICFELNEVQLGKSLENIGMEAFCFDGKLDSITIPESVNFIGELAFGHCRLSTIYYEGTKEQWNNINISDVWDYGMENREKLIINYKENEKVTNYASYNPNSINISIDGNYIKFDVQPQIINGRTLVPMRKIFEELGATVDWDDSTQTAIGTKENTVVKFTINDYTMYKNESANTLDVPAQLIDGRTLIPLRAVSEAFGCQVGWDGNDSIVSIIDDSDNYTMLYALNDRSKSFPSNTVEAQLTAGWYTEPVENIYSSNDVMMSAYLDVLNSLKGDGEWDARYVVYDIDKNGICELIIESGVASESILYFYTFNDGVVNFLGEKSGSHAYLASIPNENGVLRISAHSDFQHVSVIYISENNICEKEVMAKRFTVADYEVHNWEYYQPYEFYEGSVSLEFLESNDLSGFGDFNYIESGSVSTASYETGMKKGIGYYNDGLYYEAIEEIQWFCDGNWYNMTEEQQNNALSYLGSAKTQLADYSFESGKNYYNSGLYYEAQTDFTNALLYYKEANSSKWKEANDYLYSTNEKIKEWENREPDNNIYKTIITEETKNYRRGTDGWYKFVTCDYCHGIASFQTCHLCNGKGSFSFGKCTICNGTGLADCLYCAGSGRSLKFARAYSSYEQEIMDKVRRGEIPYWVDGRWLIVGADGTGTDYKY